MARKAPPGWGLMVTILVLGTFFAAASPSSSDDPDSPSTAADQDGQLVLAVDHSFDSGETFAARGTLTIHSLRSGSASFAQDTLTEGDRSRLRRLCDDGRGLYLLKISATGGGTHRAVADACGLVDAGLNDVFTVHLDWRSQVVGVSVAPQGTPVAGKKGSKASSSSSVSPTSSLSGFKTRVELQAMESGPQPDTAAFIQKMEQEKLAKQRGETKDNRSFFAKYWMYIVPLVLVMAMNSASPEAQGGGGGGGR